MTPNKKRDELAEAKKIHECGEAMEKHKPLDDPYCFQLGFLDGFTAAEKQYLGEIQSLKADLESVVKAAQLIVDRERKAIAGMKNPDGTNRCTYQSDVLAINLGKKLDTLKSKLGGENEKV